MIFRKTKNTHVRFERYGGFVYILNGTNQSKTKITDENEAFLFWLAVNGKPQSLNDKIQEWIAKGYLEAVGPVLLREANKNLFFERSREDKFHPKPKIVLDKLEQYSSSVGLNIAIDERMFFEILRFAAERIPRVTVTSNGSLIDKKISQRLKKEGVSALKISIDGTEDFHDKNRGYKGAYQKALQAIRYLTAEGIEVRVQSTLMRENTGSIVELMPVLSGLGVRVHSIVPVSPIGRARPQRLRRSVGGQASGDLMLSPKEYKDYVLGVNRAAKEINSKTVFEIRPVFGLDFKNNPEVLSTKYKCEALKRLLKLRQPARWFPARFFPWRWVILGLVVYKIFGCLIARIRFVGFSTINYWRENAAIAKSEKNAVAVVRLILTRFTKNTIWEMCIVGNNKIYV